MTFSKVLIANRGEIARRIMRTCRDMGYPTIAVFSEADANALFVREANEAYCIGPANAKDSYLSIDAIINAAKKSGADAIHPGYGFLSENAEFARRCEEEHIVFIGPSSSSIAQMGSKADARKLMKTQGVPVVPGYDGDAQDLDTFCAEAQKVGYPVLLKPALGGGGKGMRVVKDPNDMQTAMVSAKREAMASCGNDLLIIEKYIESPRHIEIQVVGDKQGNLIHCFERDCTLQRRHQKIIEESPSTALTQPVREAMIAAALNAARAVQYYSAGTVEFILSPKGEFYFLEMNTRLQVEHPVTEMLCDLDLVRLQLDVAAGEPLSVQQESIISRGHVIECRLYAEDTENQFLPSTGILKDFHFNELPGIRLDSGVTRGAEVSIYYDPMLAKIIARGSTRAEANRRMLSALTNASVLGVKSNRQFLMKVLQHPRWIDGTIDTHFVESENWATHSVSNNDLELAAMLATLIDVKHRSTQTQVLPALNRGYRNNGFVDSKVTWLTDEGEIELSYRVNRTNEMVISSATQTRKVALLSQTDMVYDFRVNDEIVSARVAYEPMDSDDTALVWVSAKGASSSIKRKPRFAKMDTEQNAGQCVSPMPGKVLQVFASIGQAVARGQPMVVVEAMKMEHTIASSMDGVVSAVLVSPGQLIDAQAQLVHLSAPS